MGGYSATGKQSRARHRRAPARREERGQESYLEFPAEFPLKAIGSGEGFEQWVVGVVRKHVPDLPPGASVARPSTGGKYLSVTVTFTATSQAQLDAIYSEMSRDPRVKMLL
jgi:putative lipoic acid-binding regulatory protein